MSIDCATLIRATVIVGLIESPVLTSDLASLSRPSSAKADASKKCDIGLFRLASMDRRSHPTASSFAPELGQSGIQKEQVGRDVARTESQCLLDVGFGLFSSAELNLAEADGCVRNSQIAI